MSHPSPEIKRLLAIAEERDFEVMDSLDPDLEDMYCELRLAGKSPDEAMAILRSPAPPPTGQGTAKEDRCETC